MTKSEEIKKCPQCNKCLRAFTVTVDWKDRKYHKRCYNNMIDMKEFCQRMDSKYGTNVYETLKKNNKDT